jgi:hypothetical protein
MLLLAALAPAVNAQAQSSVTVYPGEVVTMEWGCFALSSNQGSITASEYATGSIASWVSPSTYDCGSMGPGGGGYWSYTLSVPSDAAPGVYTLEWAGSCQDEGWGNGCTWTPGSVTVTVSWNSESTTEESQPNTTESQPPAGQTTESQPPQGQTTEEVPVPDYIPAAQDQQESNFLSQTLNSYLIYSATHPILDCTNQMITNWGKCELDGVTYTFGTSEDRIIAYAKEVLTDKAMDAMWEATEEMIPAAGPIIAIKDAVGKVWDVYNKFYEIQTLISSPEQGATVDIGPFTITASIPQAPPSNWSAEIAQWANTHQDSLQFVQVNMDTANNAVTVEDTSDSVVDLSGGTVSGTVPLLRSVFAIALPAENGTQAQDVVQMVQSQSQYSFLGSKSTTFLIAGAAVVGAAVVIAVVAAVRFRGGGARKAAPVPQYPRVSGAATRYCPNCGAPMSQRARFCNRCGTAS